MAASLEKQRGLKINQNNLSSFYSIEVKLHKIFPIRIKIYLHYLNLQDENNPFYMKKQSQAILLSTGHLIEG